MLFDGNVFELHEAGAHDAVDRLTRCIRHEMEMKTFYRSHVEFIVLVVRICRFSYA